MQAFLILGHVIRAQIAADICFEVAELRRQQDEITNAVRDYQEALTYDDMNVKV